MTSRGSCPLRESSSSPTAKPARAAGDASVTEVTVGADICPGYCRWGASAVQGQGRGNWVVMPAAPLRGPDMMARTRPGKGRRSRAASIPTLTVRMVRPRVLRIGGQGPVLDHGVQARGVRLGQGERQAVSGIPDHEALLDPGGADPDRAQGAHAGRRPVDADLLHAPAPLGPGRQIGQAVEDLGWRAPPG